MRYGLRWSLIGVTAFATLFVAGSGFASSSAPTRGQAPPRATSPPTVEGTAREGQTLRASNGVWANSPTRFTYQWQRCDSAGRFCTNVAGATQSTFRLTQTDVGRRLRVLVTASNADGAATATSQSSPIVADNSAPRNTSRPTITGTPVVGEELTANPGQWSGGPERFRYQWQRCDPDGANCANVAGATSETYGVRRADVDHTLRVQVTATNDLGSATTTSDRTRVVTAEQPTGGGGATAGAISISSVSLPNRLVVARVDFEPNFIRSRAEPLVARFFVTDSRGRPVRDALVYAIGVPSNRVSFEGERRTDATGWATFTYQPLAGLPMKSGATLVFFVRARKAGENLLAGVSTRRLVSIRVIPG
jgi:hypothetical protein